MLQTDLHHQEPKLATGSLLEPIPTGLSADNTVNLQIGDVCCSFRSNDDEICNLLQQTYNVFLTEKSPDITIELESTDRMKPEDLYKALSKTEYFHDKKKRFRTSSKIISGQYDLEKRFIRIIGEKSLINPDMENNHLNKLLAMSYYSACKVKYGDVPPAMLIHASGILRHGQVLMFTGPSEAGKTTVATLCREQDWEVINDEILLVSQPGATIKNIEVRSAPFLGRFTPNRQVTAPLRSIFMLKKSHRILTRPLDRTEAYVKMMRQIITPAYIGQSSKRAVLALIADFSKALTEAVPIYELEFTLDGESLWKTVDEP